MYGVSGHVRSDKSRSRSRIDDENYTLRRRADKKRREKEMHGSFRGTLRPEHVVQFVS